LMALNMVFVKIIRNNKQKNTRLQYISMGGGSKNDTDKKGVDKVKQ
jgi:hypothetical protein